MLFHYPPFFARIAAALLAAVLLAGHGAPVRGERLQQTGVVRVESLNMRTAPNLEAPVAAVLEKDSEVRILQEGEKWLQVIYKGTIGYIYDNQDYLERYARHRVTDEGPEADLEVAAARAREIERRISRKQQELESVEKEHDAAASDLDELDRRISREKSSLRQIMEKAENTSARIRMLEQQAEEVRRDMDEKKDYAGRRMAALYRLHRLGAMNLLAEAGAVHQVFRRMAAVERILEHDKEILSEMAEKRRQLSGVLEKLRKERRENQRLAEQYERKISELARMRMKRKAVAKALEREKSDSEKTLAYLRDVAGRLDEAMENLRQSRDEHGGRFREHQGLLKMPVQGKIVSDFGQHVSSDTGVESQSNGIEIRSEYGDPVRTVFEGKTVFADWVRGFGRVVIVSHGDGYHTVYGRLEEIFPQEGEKVETGQVIATVGDSGSRQGPGLYFEIRSGGDPVDPGKWLEKG
ncbi:MAG: peptidoglycan DD-metalloendopeptidase family protein [Desulfosalsimonas sp.]